MLKSDWIFNIFFRLISFRSHDGYEDNEDKISVPKNGSHYAGQQTVFNDLGKGLLNNAIEGKFVLLAHLSLVLFNTQTCTNILI